MEELDLDDDFVRAMLHRNHEPTEAWTTGGDLIGVGCRTCGHMWPCPTRKLLIEHFKEAIEISEYNQRSNMQ